MFKQTVFLGNPHHEAMIWGVEHEPDNMRWRVLESYDGGKLWLVNCYCKSEAACYKFISSWMEEYNITN